MNPNQMVENLIKRTKSQKLSWRQPEEEPDHDNRSDAYGVNNLFSSVSSRTPNITEFAGLPFSFRSMYCDFDSARFFLERDRSQPFSTALNYSLYINPNKDAQNAKKIKINAEDGKIARLINAVLDQIQIQTREQNQELERIEKLLQDND